MNFILLIHGICCVDKAVVQPFAKRTCFPYGLDVLCVIGNSQAILTDKKQRVVYFSRAVRSIFCYAQLRYSLRVDRSYRAPMSQHSPRFPLSRPQVPRDITSRRTEMPYGDSCDDKEASAKCLCQAFEFSDFGVQSMFSLFN